MMESCTTFTFIANDNETSSSSVLVTVNITHPAQLRLAFQTETR